MSEMEYIITSGYIKKTNRTSIREIQLAMKLKKVFQEGLHEVN